MFSELKEADVARFPVGDAVALTDALRPLVGDAALREASLPRLGKHSIPASAAGIRRPPGPEGVYEMALNRFSERKVRA